MSRCAWAEGQFPEYVRYHDEEWGVPVHDDIIQFEFLVLESAQAGLSWATVLKKRENYRTAFANFEPDIVAQFSDPELEAMLQNVGLIRNRAKLSAAINNAQRFLEVQQEFGSFTKYLWGFVDHQPVINHWKSSKEIPAKTALSDAIAKDLKKRGFKFLGSTVIYAHLQACGLVMDHTKDCFRYPQLT